VTGEALAEARLRMAPRPDPDRIAAHLRDSFGIEVSGLRQMDLGVFHVRRADGPDWVARVFPPIRPYSATAGDAEILQALAEQGFASERAAVPDPISVLDGHSVLVTEFAAGVAGPERRAVISQLGGMRRLGDLLGQLHAMPRADVGALGRPGGAWHTLVDGSPQDELSAIRDLLEDRAEIAPASERAACDALRREVDGLDAGAGLPEALLHPDFAVPNVVAVPEQGMVLIDWTGAGRGPRAWSLAWFLYTGAARNVLRVDLIAAGYQQHIRLEQEELERLEPMIRARPVVLTAWSYSLGRLPAAEAAQRVAEAREIAAGAAARAREVFG
jgi:Ser/Thr protein kinase RdoA (MazF antagonist)